MTDNATFTSQRSRLFGIAYRMTGSVMDAEDLVQETFLRWSALDQNEIDNPAAYLTTVVTRLVIDHLRSARVQRETYIGPWLPEPVLTAPAAGPAQQTAQRESLSFAFLIMKAPANTRAEMQQLNGSAGLIVYVDDTVYATLLFETAADRLQAVRVVVNPEKLAGVKDASVLR